MPKGYIIGHITVHDPEAHRDDTDRDTPGLDGHLGRVIVWGGSSATGEGDSLNRHGMIEFPSFVAAKRADHDPADQEVADIRRHTASSTIKFVEGS